MRISTQQLFVGNQQNMQRITADLSNTQQQLSTGFRVNSPSDDPVAATRILQINQELAQVAQFQRNIDLAQNRLNQEDATLGGINDVLIRVRELGIQSGNGGLSADDRKFIAAEIRQRLDQLVGQMNSKDSSGEYVFGGFQGSSPPFVPDSTGAIAYVGDEGQRSIEVDEGLKVQVNDNGKRLFVDLPAQVTSFKTSANLSNTGTGAITTGQILDKATLESFAPDDIIVEFDQDLAAVPPITLGYRLRASGGGQELQALTSFAPGDTIQTQGLQFVVNGTPAIGDTFFVQTDTSVVKQPLTGTLEKLIKGLEGFNETPQGRVDFNNLLADVLGEIDVAQTRVLETRAQVGARLNTIDTTRDFHADAGIVTQQVLSDLRDLDFAEAASRLSLQSTVLQAAQQSFVQTTRLSLFDRL